MKPLITWEMLIADRNAVEQIGGNGKPLLLWAGPVTPPNVSDLRNLGVWEMVGAFRHSLL